MREMCRFHLTAGIMSYTALYITPCVKGGTPPKYGLALTAKERATITTWWDEALHTALARFQARGEVDALDQVMACLPVWADRHHERWSRQGWREPSAHEIMALFTDYLMVCEAC